MTAQNKTHEQLDQSKKVDFEGHKIGDALLEECIKYRTAFPLAERDLIIDYADSQNDYKAIQEQLQFLAKRVELLIEKLPTPQEVQLLLENINTLYDNVEVRKYRQEQLIPLLSISRNVHENNNKLFPKKYEDSVEVKEV